MTHSRQDLVFESDEHRKAVKALSDRSLLSFDTLGELNKALCDLTIAQLKLKRAVEAIYQWDQNNKEARQ